MHPPDPRPSVIALAYRKRGKSERGFAQRGVENFGRSKLSSLPTWLVLFFCGFGLPGTSQAASSLETWRDDVGRIRKLADNDVPRAYAEAQTLQSAFPVDATPADHMRMLNLLSRIEIYAASTEQAATHARAALEMAKQHADRIGQAEADLNLALISIDQAKIDVLIEVTTDSVRVLEGVNRPDLLGEALLRTAMMHARLGKTDESVAMCVQAMEIARRTKNPLALAYAHQGLGVSFAHSDHHQEASDHFLQMRDQARAANSRFLEAHAIASRGSELGTLGDFDGAERLIREAIAIFREVGMPFAVNSSLLGLAHLYLTHGRHRDAEPLFDEVIATYGQRPNKIGLWWALNARGSNYLSMGENTAALADAERSHALAQDIGLPLYSSESSTRLASIAAKNGDHRRAYELSLEASEIATNAARAKRSERVVELVERYESESKLRQIEELTRLNEQQSAELRQRMLQQRWLWTVLGGSIAVLIGSAWFLLRLRRSHRLLAATHTKMQNSKNELQKQTGILDSIIHSMGEGVCVANEHGEMILVNPAGEEILGIGATEGDPSGWSQRYGIFLPDQVTSYPPAQLPLARAMRGERCDNVELFVRNAMLKEGRWLAVNARPLRDKTDQVRGGVAVFSDVSARKHVDEEIRAANATLEQRVNERTRELEAFSYSVSHDLRAPLRSMHGFSRVLLEDYEDKLDEEGKDSLRRICAASERMDLLIDDMLELSRVTRDQMRRGRVDLSAMASAVAAGLRESAPEQQMEFVIAPNLAATGDARLLQIVLQNLLGNAAKFSRRRPVARIEFGLTTRDGGPVYFVRDNGAGFDLTYAKKLFGAFQRFHSKAEFPGSGIGLATVQRIIHRHGGHVYAESQVDRGATFYFTLPDNPT